MAETLQQQAAAGERARHDTAEREKRIANCEMEWTDGALSIWAEGITSRKGQMAQAILDAGGQWYFWRCELIDLATGEPAAAKLIDGQFGKCWALTDAAGTFTGKFITAHPARKATLGRKGYAERITLFAAEATADIAGTGTGLSGNAWAITRTKDRSIEFTGTCGGGTREDAEAHIETLRANGFAWQEMAIA